MQYIIWAIVFMYIVMKHWNKPIYEKPEYTVRPTYNRETIDIQGDIIQVK